MDLDTVTTSIPATIELAISGIEALAVAVLVAAIIFASCRYLLHLNHARFTRLRKLQGTTWESSTAKLGVAGCRRRCTNRHFPTYFGECWGARTARPGTNVS